MAAVSVRQESYPTQIYAFAPSRIAAGAIHLGEWGEGKAEDRAGDKAEGEGLGKAGDGVGKVPNPGLVSECDGEPGGN